MACLYALFRSNLSGRFLKRTTYGQGSYQREVKNVLALYNEVVKDITTNLEAQLTQSEAAELETADEVDPKAYEAYLRGVFHWEKLSQIAKSHGIGDLRDVEIGGLQEFFGLCKT